jgi:hypothetical protein
VSLLPHIRFAVTAVTTMAGKLLKKKPEKSLAIGEKDENPSLFL